MVSYYFSETKKVEGDATNVRFNFNPTYVAVGDQFVISATAELARDLIDVLQAEKQAKPSKPRRCGRGLMRGGLARTSCAPNQDVTLTQLILARRLAAQDREGGAAHDPPLARATRQLAARNELRRQRFPL